MHAVAGRPSSDYAKEDDWLHMKQHPEAPSSKAPEKRSPFAFLDWLPWETITIWALFLGAVYVLRSFFFIVFMTFIVAYTMRGLVVRLAGVLSAKRDSVWLERAISVICFAALLAAIGGLGRYFGPLLFDQGKLLVGKVDTFDNPQGKFDDLLQETVGRYLVSERDCTTNSTPSSGAFSHASKSSFARRS